MKKTMVPLKGRRYESKTGQRTWKHGKYQIVESRDHFDVTHDKRYFGTWEVFSEATDAIDRHRNYNK